MVDNSILNLIYQIFARIWSVGNSIQILGVGLWWYLFSLIVIWVLFSVFLSFVKRNSLDVTNRDKYNNI